MLSITSSNAGFSVFPCLSGQVQITRTRLSCPKAVTTYPCVAPPNVPETVNSDLRVFPKPVEEARRNLARVDLDDLEVDGEAPEGSMTFKPPGEDKEQTFPVKFKKVGRRWYLHTQGLDHYDDPAFRYLFGGGWL